MKKNCFMPLVVLILLWGSCKDVNVVEKLVFTEADIKKCECPDKTAICYYDTVKTFLIELNNVTGTLRKSAFDSTKVYGITLDNAYHYITGSKEFGQPFYYWWLMNGYLNFCNWPSEIENNSKLKGKKVIFSCKALVFPPPMPGMSYPSTEGYPSTLQKIKILDN
jgi:hypothetical protein